MRWFSRQPYSISALASAKPHDTTTLAVGASILIRSFLALCLLVSPILIAFLARYPITNLRARRGAAIVATLFAIMTLHLALRSKPVYWLAPFLNTHGGLLGELPPSLPLPLRLVLTVLTFTVIAAFLLFLWNASDLKDIRPAAVPQLSWKAMATLLGPFTLTYVGLLATRSSIYDRYLLPLLFVILVPVLRLYQQKIAPRLPYASVILVFLMAVFGVSNMHDLFVGHRARLAAANEIRAAGFPRTMIRAGYEYDGWTQLETTGYINNALIQNPPGAYHPWTPPPGISSACIFPFSSEVPSIVPRYSLSLSRTRCFGPSLFSPVRYTSWLPPHNHAIYIQKLR